MHINAHSRIILPTFVRLWRDQVAALLCHREREKIATMTQVAWWSRRAVSWRPIAAAWSDSRLHVVTVTAMDERNGRLSKVANGTGRTQRHRFAM